ncbi:ABC transporter permease [Bacillus sp. S3]|uniref:ABC transporter permease n=1 Tax=Bacillus sp. S3 TaxID=486398 RepID=UPI00118B7162|nr:ABC transporter permease [Bacillus sp. S3]QCJ44783.1 ABC transporter permease [Bacillus sp. S3]
MNVIWQVMKEQLLHLNLIFRLSFFEEKSKYTTHYLGAFWQILNPMIQIGVYWFIFGFGIRGGSSVEGTPFLLWLIAGIVPWLFINPTLTQASNSIYANINLVSKMKFPVSVLPSIKIIGNSFAFLIMIVLSLGIISLKGFFPGMYLLQLPYYLLCLYSLLLSLSLLLSSLTTIVRDIQQMVQSAMRIMMYVLPIVWNVHSLPDTMVDFLQLNPFFYIIEGFRSSLLGGNWFFNDGTYTLYFWLITLFIFFVGSSIHVKFRHKFVDYI